MSARTPGMLAAKAKWDQTWERFDAEITPHHKKRLAGKITEAEYWTLYAKAKQTILDPGLKESEELER